MLKEKFVPVAIDQWYERRQKDAKGDFYRKIAGQGPRNNFEQTTQGHYACTATGKLLSFNSNHEDINRVKTMMRKAIEDFDPASYEGVEAIEAATLDSSFDLHPPKDGLVLRVHSKILSGYDEPGNKRESSFQNSIGQDNAWIQATEIEALIKVAREGGVIPAAISHRIARFHLIDNTRGEPPRWTSEEIMSIAMEISNGVIEGDVKLSTADGKRGYEAKLYGRIETSDDTVTRFDLVADGKFWGQGRHTKWAPKGKFPLAITFRMADGSALLDSVPPHGVKGWVAGYYKAEQQ